MAQNDRRASAGKLSNGPILISSQPASLNNMFNQSYASSLGAKANSAIKNLMVTSSEPDTSQKQVRKSMQAKKEHVSVEVKKLLSQHQGIVNNQQQSQSSESLEAGRGFKIIVDKNSLQNIGIGSPSSPTKSGTSKHRGYSLLNMPVNVVDSDDADREGLFDEDVTAMPQSPTNKIGLNIKYPDLFFQGWSIQPLETTLGQSRERRIKRRLKAKAKDGTKLHSGEYKITEQPTSPVELSSQEQTSVTEPKLASITIQNEPNKSQAIDSNDQRTQSLHLEEKLEIQDGTIESAKTKGFEVNDQHETEERPNYQTISINVASSTLSAKNGQTYRTNVEEQQIKVTPGASIESIQQQSHILAASSIESYGTIMKRNSHQIVRQHVDPLRSKNLSPINSSNQARNRVKPIPSSQRTPMKAPKQSQKLASPAVQKSIPINKIMTNRVSTKPVQRNKVVQAASRRDQHLRQPSPIRPILNNSSNGSMKKALASESPQRKAKLVQTNSSQKSQKRQNSSQDRIRFNNSKTQKRNGQKNAPPMQPGLRRFKTQKDGHQLVRQILPKFAVENDNVDTSSFNEDISQNQPTKLDLLEYGSSGKGKRAMMHNVSLHDETVQFSDAGLKELSVVESDNSDQGLETPAAYLRAKVKLGGFQDHSGMQQPMSSVHSNDAQASPDKTPNQLVGQDKAIQKAKTMQIQVQDAENESIVSHSMLTESKKNDLASFDPNANKTKQIRVGSRVLNQANQKQISYLSSNDSAILAKSNLMSSTTPNKPKADALSGNVLDRVQNVAQSKDSQQHGVNMQNLLLPTKQSSNVHGKSPKRKISKAGRDSDSFAQKRLSSSYCAPFKRSNTKDEKGKKLQDLKLVQTTSCEKPINPRNNIKAYKKPSNMRMAKNMPMRSNQKAQQNYRKFNQTFVDSDFYENQSITKSVYAQGLTNKMRSTSPVSSQASTFLKQTSIRTRKSNIIDSSIQEIQEVNNKSRLKDDSEKKQKANLMEMHERDLLIYYTKQRNKNLSQERELMRKQKLAEQMVQQKEQRLTSRIGYQQKFIERRERQVQIVNKQAYEKSDQDSKALAYAMSTRERDSSLHDNQRSFQRTTSLRKQSGLDTLRKVHDSIGYERLSKDQKKALPGYQNRSSVKHSMEYRNNQKNRTNLTEIYNSVNISDKEYGGIYNIQGLDVKAQISTTNADILYSSYEQRVGSHEIAQENNQLNEYSLVSHQQSNTGMQPSDQGFGDKQQQAFNMEERGGQKLTSDDSYQKTIHDYQADEQYSPANNNLTLKSASPQKFQKPFGNISSTTKSRQFRVPKIRAPQKYQKVVERQYNMLQTEDDTYFLPGHASQSVYKTSVAVSQPTSINPRARQVMQHEADKSDINCDEMMIIDQPISIIEHRKKSHELNSVRSKKQSDEARIQKLTDQSMSKKIEKYRQKMSISGRDDPQNVLGYQNLQPWQPSTMKHNRPENRNRTAAAQLNPIKDRKVILTTGSEGIQKNINGMLDKLNRAKTMRIANQVLKEQQQQFYSVQHRREQLNSQGNQVTDRRRQNLACTYSQSPSKVASLQIQTNMPQIAGMHAPQPSSNSGLSSPINYRTQQPNTMAFLASSGPPDQRKSSGAIKQKNYADLLKQMSNNSKQNDPSFGTSACAAKPETPLANTGLRIIQTNHPSALNNKR